MGSHGIKDRVAIVGMGCTAFGDGSRDTGFERGTRRVFRQLFNEPVSFSFGCEADGGFAGLAFPELSHLPGVGRVETVLQHRGERVLAAPLELDERLCLVVEAE